VICYPMTVSIGLGRVLFIFSSLVVGWLGLGRVIQNGPMDNSAVSTHLCPELPPLQPRGPIYENKYLTIYHKMVLSLS